MTSYKKLMGKVSLALFAVLLISPAWGYTNTSPITQPPRYGYNNQQLSMLDDTQANLLSRGRAYVLGYEVNLGQTDNIDRVTLNQEAANYIVIKPYVGFSKVHRDHVFWANARGAFSGFTTGKDDQYQDSELQLASRLNSNGLHRFELDARLKKGHEIFNYERAQVAGITEENLDRYDQPRFSGRYILGRSAARLRLAIWADIVERDYSNNRYATRYYDFSRHGFGLQGWYQLAQKTQMVVGIDRISTQYDEIEPGFSTKDKDENQLFVGLRWLATGNTSGEFRVGLRHTNYASSSYGDSNHIYWRLLVDWRPSAKDGIQFSTSESTSETRFSDVVDIERRRYTLHWTHQWARRWSSRLGVELEEAGYLGNVGANRRDNNWRYVASVQRIWGRKLTSGLGYVRVDRTSNFGQYNYDRDSFELTLTKYF